MQLQKLISKFYLKMEYSQFNKCIGDTIHSYRKELIEDFVRYPNLDALVSKMCFDGKVKITDYVSNLEITDFINVKYKGPSLVKFELLKFNGIDQIDHVFEYVRPDYYDQYYFFDKKEYESYEEAVANYNGLFYLCRNDYITKIDRLFIENIEGYKTGNDKVFKKTIAEKCKIVIDARKSRAHAESIEDYIFPLIYLEHMDKKYFSGNQNDLFSFFFMNIKSYINFFYRNRQLSKTSDEPVIYHDTMVNKYVLSNSIENVNRFNKFIFLSIDLFIHYFKVFENWIIKVFIPSLRLSVSSVV